MRVFQNLFDYGDTGVLGLSTSTSNVPVPAADYGQAVLWKDGASVNLLELCTRAVGMDALREAVCSRRDSHTRMCESARIAGAEHARRVAGVRMQFDWAEAHFSENFRELPTGAMQLGGNLLLMNFVEAVKPHLWRLVDVAQRRIVWEGYSNAIKDVLGPPPYESPREHGQLLLAAGASFAEILIETCNVVLILDGDALVPAAWSLKKQKSGADNCGMRSGMLSRPFGDENVYVLIDPRTGEAINSFSAPTQSKSWSRPVAVPRTDRIAIPHRGGTVDIVDGFGDTHFTIRPFPQLSRTQEMRVRLSHDAEWLSAYERGVFRVVNLSTREVAELSVPAPNMEDGIDCVLYNEDALATGYSVALMDQSGLSVIPYADLDWQPVTQPGRGAGKKAATVYKKYLDLWRKPALTLKPAKKGRSWLYGSADLPAVHVPQHDGRPMQLLARIDLQEAATLLPENPWPKEGALYFFTAVDAEGTPLEDDLFNASTTRVLWWNGRFLANDNTDAVLAAKQPLKLARHKADLPDIGAAIVEAAMLGDSELEAYRAWLDKQDWADQPSGHRFGGYPTILQHNDLEAQAAHFADDAHHPPRDMAEKAEVSRWRLLLQLDSDDSFMWGADSGMLYFLIHDDDLARGDFSRVVSICEGL